MPRFWRYFKFTAFGLAGLLGLGLVWLAVANSIAGSRLQAKLAALKEAGEPVTLADLAPKPVDPETNAATFLERAQPDVEAIEKTMSAEFGDDWDVFERAKPEGKAYHAAREGLLAHPQVIEILQQASHCSVFQPPYDYQLRANVFLADELLPTMQRKRAATRILNYRAWIDLAEGRPQEAVVQCLAMLRLARLYDQEPLIINHLVAVAIRGAALGTANLALRAGPLTPETYDDLEKELAAVDPSWSLEHMLRTDRAYGIDTFGDTLNSSFFSYLSMPYGKNDACNYLDLFATLIADGPRMTLSETATNQLANSHAMTRGMEAALQATYEASARTLAQTRALRVLNALCRTGQTTAPPDLAQLNLPADALTDPYNNKPLVIKHPEGGWLIYAVGRDLRDDGGKLESVDDIGWGPQS